MTQAWRKRATDVLVVHRKHGAAEAGCADKIAVLARHNEYVGIVPQVARRNQ